jgi:hypothetical protein
MSIVANAAPEPNPERWYHWDVDDDTAEWPCVDTGEWELPVFEQPASMGRESITIGQLRDFYQGYPEGTFSDLYYVEHKIGEEVLFFRGFETIEEARAYARTRFGEGGSADNESMLDDTTISPLEYLLLEDWILGPDPEPRGDGTWRVASDWWMPGEDRADATNHGID